MEVELSNVELGRSGMVAHTSMRQLPNAKIDVDSGKDRKDQPHEMGHCCFL